MIPGYAGKCLEVDLSTGDIKDIKFADDVLREYVGGRGLAAKILWDRLGSKWETVDPLGSENILLLLTGPLTGYFPGGRTCVSGKSPQSNGVVGSTLSGEFGIELRCAGYDGIVVTGQAEEPVYLYVKDSDAEIRDAGAVWGKDAKQTVAALTRECRGLLQDRFPGKGEWKEPSMLYIGPAGENKVRTAIVGAKWTHAAGYGGYGAVMGSKRLKAVVVKGSGALPEVNSLEKILQLNEIVSADVYRNELWRRWGTGYLGYEVASKKSSEPVKNWQEEWHDKKSLGVDQYENKFWVKSYWGDFGCPTTCLKIAVIKEGKHKGAVTDAPDYELQAYLGPNLGIYTPEDIVFLSSLINDLGLCGLQTGNTLGFAAELFQRGILTKDDLDGIEPVWGSTEAFEVLARKIAHREGIGDILAEGAARAALKIGKIKNIDVSPYAVHVAGIGVGAHGIRSGKDYPQIISYACSVQGGDHTSTAYLPLSDPSSELAMIFHDSAVYCWFNMYYSEPKLKFDFYEAATGQESSQNDWDNIKALRILQLQRAMLLLGGPDLKWNLKTHDDNPQRFYEPLPSGPFKCKTVDRSRVEKERRQYYQAVGWDENGMPTTQVLKKLGLESVDTALRKLR